MKTIFHIIPADSSGSLFETRDGLWALVLVEDKVDGDGVGDTREWQLVKIEDKGDREGLNEFDVGTKLGTLKVEGERENERGAKVEVRAEDGGDDEELKTSSVGVLLGRLYEGDCSRRQYHPYRHGCARHTRERSACKTRKS